VAPAGSQGTRTFRVEVQLDNDAPDKEAQDARLLPGMSGRAAVVRAIYDQVVLIPESAILRDGAASYLFVVPPASSSTSDRTARRVEVEIIGQTGSSAVVEAGAFPERGNIQVIILGQAAVQDGSTVRIRRAHDTPPLTVFD
jgi:hypothetical protein